MNEKTELKPCPFCGGEAQSTNEDNYGYMSDEWLVECKCGTLFGFAKGYTREEAAAAWNTRTPDIVRCGECVHWWRVVNSDGYCERDDSARNETFDNYFCSYGQRKEAEK